MTDVERLWRADKIVQSALERGAGELPALLDECASLRRRLTMPRDFKTSLIESALEQCQVGLTGQYRLR